MDLQAVEKELEHLSSLTTHAGFGVLVKYLEDRKEAIENIRTVTSDDVRLFRQGQLDIIDFVIDISTFVENSLREVEEMKDADST